MTDPSARVRVTGPSRRTPRHRSRTVEIDAASALGTVYLASLMRAQRRLAAVAILAVCGTLGLLPLLFRLAPGLGSVQVLGLPLSWLVLGVAVYPFVALVAWLYVRSAERNEAAFTALVTEDDE